MVSGSRLHKVFPSCSFMRCMLWGTCDVQHAACEDAQLRLTFDNETRREEQDLSTVLGFIIGLQHTLRIERSGLLWLGVPCCSFSFLATSVHQRSWTRPLGDTQRSFVAMGNLLATRALMLAIVALSRNVYYFVEHPGSTMLAAFPYVQFALSLGNLGCRMTEGLTTRWCLGL